MITEKQKKRILEEMDAICKNGDPPSHHIEDWVNCHYDTIRALLAPSRHPDWEKFEVDVENMGEALNREEGNATFCVDTSPATATPTQAEEIAQLNEELKIMFVFYEAQVNELKSQRSDINKLTQRVSELVADRDTMTLARDILAKQVEELESVVHPYYGPCDALAPGDKCSECLEVKQYNYLEQRVRDYLQKINPDIGTGDDPIGFLIASHAAIMYDRDYLARHQTDCIGKVVEEE